MFLCAGEYILTKHDRLVDYDLRWYLWQVGIDSNVHDRFGHRLIVAILFWAKSVDGQRQISPFFSWTRRRKKNSVCTGKAANYRKSVFLPEFIIYTVHRHTSTRALTSAVSTAFVLCTNVAALVQRTVNGVSVHTTNHSTLWAVCSRRYVVRAESVCACGTYGLFGYVFTVLASRSLSMHMPVCERRIFLPSVLCARVRTFSMQAIDCATVRATRT